MKILVIGAGVGGVVCAYHLAKKGHNVCVIEQKSYEKVTYDWHDDIAKTSFENAGIPTPPKEFYFDKRNWGFVAPNSKKHVYAPLDEATDVSIERRPFLYWLCDLAKSVGVEFKFDTKAELLCENEKVVGAKVNGESVLADLLVDNAGVDSVIRANLPLSYGIQRHAEKGEVFCAYRGFFNKNDVAVKDEDTNLAYLLHNGKKGISWCIADPREDVVDILIGQIDALSDADVAFALDSLKNDNPVLGDKLIRGGKVCRIPVRYPLTKMVGDNFAIIGDSAFMTIPMLGSGMASSMLAGRILAETVCETNDVSLKGLWKYQVEFFKQCGATHCGIDVIKRWLLSADPDDVKFLFEKGVLSEKDINSGAGGSTIKLSPKDLLVKLAKGITRIGLLLDLSGVVNKSNKAVKLANEIPEEYDEKRVSEWEEKLNKLFE